MDSEKVLTLTDENFEHEVLQSVVPVVVDFWAEWCMPCRMLAPTLHELAEDYGERIKVGKIDTDANRNISLKYGISAIPTVIIFKSGELAKRFVGLQTKQIFAAALDELLA
ncbi:MAG: thioredoxin [Planctomycetes bacterium]|nr:thioredoxin [Planctomycetota bacterium]